MFDNTYKILNPKFEFLNPKQLLIPKFKNQKSTLLYLNIIICNLFSALCLGFSILNATGGDDV